MSITGGLSALFGEVELLAFAFHFGPLHVLSVTRRKHRPAP